MTAVPNPGAPGPAIRVAHLWNPNIEPPKTDYKKERIQLNDWPSENFRDDRKDEGKKPIGFHIYGLCPSCKHQTSALCAVEYLEDDQDLVTAAQDQERAIRKGRAGSTTVVTVLLCDCLEDHAGAPAGSSGCGTDWLLRVNYDRNNPGAEVYLHPVKADEAFRYWLPAEDVTSAIPTALAAVQATAGKWQTALAALTAVLGVSAVISGGSTIAALDPTWKALLGLAAAVAVIGNVTMLYFSDLASLGFPGLHGAKQKRSLLDADLEPLKQAAATVREIRIARIATAVALLWGVCRNRYLPVRSPSCPKGGIQADGDDRAFRNQDNDADNWLWHGNDCS